MRISASTVARSLIPFLLVSISIRLAAADGVDEVTPGQGTLQARNAIGELVSMPLRHTDVQAEVTGFVARVEVVQTFGNPFESGIEARYVFPLPERAAVDGFLLEVGERRIHGEIRRREEARRVYETARAAGHTASLLDQERPNIFTQSVANIPPGKEVKVHLRYVDTLPYADGAYRFVFPMVVGPRYSPGSTAPALGPDRDSIATAHLEPGFRTGHDIAITLDLDAGVPIRSITSESHKIAVTSVGSTRARVALAPEDTLPNKDLMLRWEVAGVMPEVGLLAHRDDDEGFVALLILPKAEVTADEASPKEIIFVLDQSGSMSGPPIEVSRRFMRLALQTLGPRDRFNIVRFDSSATVLAPEPLASTQENVRRGLRAVEVMRGSGGTEMLAGFDAALSQPHDPGCIRIIFFLTDGYIGNEEDVFAVIRQRRGDARIFALGIGSSVNHHLLRGMADLGRGVYQYVRPDGRAKEAVERFQRWVTKPYLTDLEVDWGGLRVEDVQPSRLPDLYSGQTLSVVGRYLWGGSDTVIIRGRLGGVPWEKQVEVTLPERSASHAALASVWARQRIQDLLMQPGATSRRETEAQVTSLALAFRLMSPFTSFVAVDDSAVVNPGGELLRVNQPSPMPEFVSFEGCFGAEGPGRTESMPIPGPVAPGAGSARGDIRTIAGDAPPGQAVVGGAVRDTEGGGLPGVVVVLVSRTLGVSRPTVSDVEGRYGIGAVTPGSDYIIRVDHPGFGSVEVGPLTLEAGRVSSVDILLRSSAELTEAVTVTVAGDVVDAEATSTSTTFSAEFLANLPVIGHGNENLLALRQATTDTDGDGNPDVHGARDTGLQQRHAVDLTEPAGGGESASIEEAALHVLADLADDGRLSRSEGLPALAALLAAQYSNGGFSRSVRAQTLATWALAAAASSGPRLRWVPDATRRAAGFLTLLRASYGTMPLDADALVDFVLEYSRASGRTDESSIPMGLTDRCVDPRRPLEQLRSDLVPSGARLIDRMLRGLHSASAPAESP